MSPHPLPKRLALAAAIAGALLVVPAAAQADLVINGKTFATQEAAPLARSIIAVFSDDQGPASCSASGYTATIDWGDGTPVAPAKVNFLFGGDFGQCQFNVTGDHKYAKFGVFTTTTNVSGGPLAHSGVGTGEITVADVNIEADDRTPTATANSAFTGEVARFKDANPFSQAGDFTSSIDWGDGTPITTGVISGENGDFSVSGTHTYGSAGTFPVRVTFAHPTSAPAVALSTMTVAPGALAPQAPQNPTVNPTGVFRASPAAISLSGLKRKGLKLRIGVGATTAKSLTLEVRNSANKRVGTQKLKLTRTGTVTLTWKPSRTLASKLRSGRSYGLRIRLPGGPTLQTGFRLKSAPR